MSRRVASLSSRASRPPQVTLKNFEAAMDRSKMGPTMSTGAGTDIVGTCSFRPVSPVVTKAQAFAKRNGTDSSKPAGAQLTSSEYPISECDGKYGADNFPGGHNATVPCGVYGCACKYSPGKCQ